MNTPSQQKARANAAIDGRGKNAAYSAGARTAQEFKNSKGYNVSEAEGMRNAWQRQEDVQTYTRTRNGQMSVNGRNTKDAKTWTFTPKNDDGSAVLNQKGEARQSGRSKLANRRQRDYDVRSGMNNISPRVIQAWLDNGMARMVDGNMVGAGGNVIRQKANGNYTMGLATG